MSRAHDRSALASYRDEIADLLDAGEQFGEVEDAIEALADLTKDEKAALWLFGFSLRNPVEQRRDAAAYLAALA